MSHGDVSKKKKKGQWSWCNGYVEKRKMRNLECIVYTYRIQLMDKNLVLIFDRVNDCPLGGDRANKLSIEQFL